MDRAPAQKEMKEGYPAHINANTATRHTYTYLGDVLQRISQRPANQGLELMS